MWRKPLLILMAASLGLSMATACGGKKVSSEKVLEDIVVAMCKKMTTCQPNAMPSEDFCKTTMKNALSSNKELPKVEASRKQLDTCVASINNSSCENLLGSKPPEGCDFLQ